MTDIRELYGMLTPKIAGEAQLFALDNGISTIDGLVEAIKGGAPGLNPSVALKVRNALEDMGVEVEAGKPTMRVSFTDKAVTINGREFKRLYHIAFSDEQFSEMARLYNEGCGYAQIAEALGATNPRTVKDYLLRAGLPFEARNL